MPEPRSLDDLYGDAMRLLGDPAGDIETSRQEPRSDDNSTSPVSTHPADGHEADGGAS